MFYGSFPSETILASFSRPSSSISSGREPLRQRPFTGRCLSCHPNSSDKILNKLSLAQIAMDLAHWHKSLCSVAVV